VALIFTALIAALASVAVMIGLVRLGAAPVSPWSRLGTDDVHALSFVGDDPSRLLLGHHGGIMSSIDGGRTWQPLATGSDAMSLGAATDGSIVIAGHDVLAQSVDDGRTWQEIAAALPSVDIHGFARDPNRPGRMWAYLATGGLWASQDAGRTWEKVAEDNVLFPVAIAGPTGSRLFGVTTEGLASSDDGGRTWREVATPELYPIMSLAASPDGTVLVAGGSDGLARSEDGGTTWAKLPLGVQAFAVAIAAKGQTIGVVTRSSEFFRSDHGGRTWAGAPTAGTLQALAALR